MRYAAMVGRLARLAVRRPAVGVALARSAWRFRARGWFRRPPFLPLPPAEYMAWRMHTAYGDEDAEPSGQELERYLRWTARMNRRRAS